MDKEIVYVVIDEETIPYEGSYWKLICVTTDFEKAVRAKVLKEKENSLSAWGGENISTFIIDVPNEEINLIGFNFTNRVEFKEDKDE